MAEQQLSAEEQKILALIQQVKVSLAPDNKKAITALKNSRKLLDDAIKLLEGSESTDVKDKAIDSDAPYGRKLDGIAKRAPGRAAVKPTIDVKPATEQDSSHEPSV